MAFEFNTLITSGALIAEEMQAEFGPIPPAFLPIGSSYLLQHQMSYLRERNSVWLSLPSDFTVQPENEKVIRDTKIQTLKVDRKKSLGFSIFQSLIEIGLDKPMEILHGDTLIQGPPKPNHDSVSVAFATDQYRWGIVETDGLEITGFSKGGSDTKLNDGTEILTGHFSITKPWLFLKCLAKTDFSFTEALNKYHIKNNFTANRNIRALDFGHQKTFYASRRDFTAARHFNSITIFDNVVKKKSLDTQKIDAEANWLRNVPAELQPYTVRLIEDKVNSTSGEYSTLYSCMPSLADLYLAHSSPLVWKKVLDSCVDFLSRAYSHQHENLSSSFSWLVVEKLEKRLSEYPEFLPRTDQPLTINGCSVGTLNDIIDHIRSIVSNAPEMPACVMHGDFCFSNILFDTRSDRIQLIDPRGLLKCGPTLYGDMRYDLAKLGHSAIGRYDQIIGDQLGFESNRNGEYSLVVPKDDLRDWIENEFHEREVNGVRFDSPEVSAAIVSLFLSMIPLHSDKPKRQEVLFANALRVYQRFFICQQREDR